eukprot:TRINITY_DN11024_c0_g1_i1.p1 TRINITY_DN11024_c0_g1~~TRINITY_DN11024_c0_g1_i1.p1  ORF type:complete len:501 (+),score=56.41 TRINITY_DN11024_c0_g1_i1:89-1504(+)
MSRQVDSLYQRSKNKWDSLDLLATKATSVFLGAFLVSLIEDYKYHPVSFAWTFMINCTMICPPIAMVMDTYGKKTNIGVGSRFVDDARHLLSKAAIQILAWAIKKWAAGPVFHWGEHLRYDLTTAGTFFVVYYVLVVFVKWAKLKKGKRPPFSDGDIIGGVKQIFDGFLMIWIGAMPTTIGYVINRVYLSIKELIVATDYVYTESPMLLYVFYFIGVAFVSVGILSHPNTFKSLKKPETDYELLSVTGQDNHMDASDRIARIELMLSGCKECEPTHAEEGMGGPTCSVQAVRNALSDAWSVVIEQSVKYSFAWAAYYLLKDFVIRFLGGCNIRPEGSSKHCDIEVHFYFALSLLLSFSIYLPAISTVRSQKGDDPREVAWFRLQRTAIPVLVGWSWNLYVGRVAENAYGMSTLAMLGACALVTIPFYSTYMSISRDLRLKKLIAYDVYVHDDEEGSNVAVEGRTIKQRTSA